MGTDISIAEFSLTVEADSSDDIKLARHCLRKKLAACSEDSNVVVGLRLYHHDMPNRS